MRDQTYEVIADFEFPNTNLVKEGLLLASLQPRRRIKYLPEAEEQSSILLWVQ